MLQTQLATAQEKAAAHDGLVGQVSDLSKKLAAEVEGGERRSALVAIGVVDEAMAGNFVALYDSAVAGMEAEARPTFGDWIALEEGGARANPLLSGFFTPAAESGTSAAPEGGTPATVPVVPRVPSTFPASNSGAAPGVPPVRAGTMSSGQLRAMFQKMTPDQVAAWQAQHGAAYGHGAPPATE
jgi:hypothetical protein